MIAESGKYADVGHTALVKQVFPDGRILLEEANSPKPGVYQRVGRPSELGIVGYFVPSAGK
jgi:surface antigen